MHPFTTFYFFRGIIKKKKLYDTIKKKQFLYNNAKGKTAKWMNERKLKEKKKLPIVFFLK